MEIRGTSGSSASLNVIHPQPSSEVQIVNRRARAGHKKSRSGCFTCKLRKIKCQENRPFCNNCLKIKVECKYPVPMRRIGGDRSLTPPIRDVVQLQSTPTYFNRTDMRLFHHFLFNSYPHLPLGNEQVWVTELASLAHCYDFLIHAFLGLAASHLCMTSTSKLKYEALSHRVIAIKGLNQALTTPPKTRADSDAITSACYALALQSSFIGESVKEFLMMLRGCRLVTSQKWYKTLGTSFKVLDLEDQTQVAFERLRCVPIIDERITAPAKTSLDQLQKICSSDAQVKLLGWLKEVVEACGYSSREAYFKYFDLCTGLGTLPESDFQMLLDSHQHVMALLLAHYVAILVLIYPIKAMEWSGRDLGRPNRSYIFRLDNVIDHVPLKLRQYLLWPLSIIKQFGDDEQT